MKKSTAERIGSASVSTPETARPAQVNDSYPAYIGLDVHKEIIAVASARPGRDPPRLR